jgi:hypothetical protein
MNRLIVICIVIAVLSVECVLATNAVERLKVRVKLAEDAKISEHSISATRLTSPPTFSMGSSASFPSSASSFGSSMVTSIGSVSGGGGGGSSCNPQPSCQNDFSNGDGGNNNGGSIDEAVRPIDDWIKDFRKRTGDSSDLYTAAKATVKPLIDKLRRNQRRAQDRLRESNEGILKHVEDAATQHIYALLKVDKAKMEQQEAQESLANRVLEAKAREKAMQDEHAAVLGLGSESAAAIESALKSAGMKPTKTVVDHIANILESSQSSSTASSLVSSLASAVKKAKKKN